MRPEFDHEEEYLVAYYRKYRKSGKTGLPLTEMTAVLMGTLFFGMGWFKEDVTWSAIGFILVAWRVLRYSISGERYNTIISGIIEKYEDALRDGATPGRAEGRSPSDLESP